MNPNLLVFVSSPRSAYVALGIVILMIVVAVYRRLTIRRLSKICVVIGSLCLALATGQPIWNHTTPGKVTVMVDLSPSTRGATFRDRAALLARIHQLLGETHFELLAFSDHNQPLPDLLTDLPSDKTVFSPPQGDPVLLFSDGQFEIPAYAPPTYPVIDPALDHPADAAVTDLNPFGQQVLATIRNNATTRPIRWTNATPAKKGVITDYDNSSKSVMTPFSQLAKPDGAGEVTAGLPPGDLWPENDLLSLALSPPVNREKWWIGQGAPTGWQTFDPGAIPTEISEYLRPTVIVLKNIPADSLSSIQQQRLLQYVRDLGGSIVIVGGNQAFAAGAYDGTPLDDLSPLASSPPEPTMRWLLLIDASGSMAGDGSATSPWQVECNAVTQLLPQLPANDTVSIGSFAEKLQWWSTGKSAADTRQLQFPPPKITPKGPTNLAAALAQIDSSANKSLPTQLLLMTDADADLPNVDELARSFAEKKVHLSLLAIGHGKALPTLEALASVTAGSVQTQLDSKQWISSANLLLRSALPSRYQHQRLQTTDRWVIPEWNQTWLKSSAEVLEKSSGVPLAAKWQLGLGQVTAIAYPAALSRIEPFVDQIAATPSDPGFIIEYTTGSTLHIKVSAIHEDQYRNGQSLQMEMLDDESAGTKTFAIPQTAPGQYEIAIPAEKASQLITIRNQTSLLKQFAIAGRYPPEFDRIGNDRANLQALADRTGTVINPGSVQPIQFHWPTRQIPITSELAFAGFAMISLGLIWNRRR